MLLSCLRNCIDSSIHKDQQRAFCHYKSIRESIKKELSSLDRESLQILKESLQVQKMANEENKFGYSLAFLVVVPLIISIVTFLAPFMTEMYSLASSFISAFLTTTKQPAHEFTTFYKQFTTFFAKQMIWIWVMITILSAIMSGLIYCFSYYTKCQRYLYVSYKLAVIKELLSSNNSHHL
ncbi:MAG: hypothetical protein ACUVTU_12330 [Desulfurispora sp.]|uniref:hypothetical protein n=1 Tax=Desulfurispora sp. TaxID=3014275 RepID=UPI00404958E7